MINRSNKNSVFIAYHGSEEEHGTYEIGRNLLRQIEAKFPVINAYCGPNSSMDKTFAEHANIVIPRSLTFLLVVNDSCPTDASGQLTKDRSHYLYGEIEAFFKLYRRDSRSKKDFAVFYAGNKRKNFEEKAAFIKRLLSPIDANFELFDGNQYYILDNVGLDRWVDDRLVKMQSRLELDSDYYPFDLLQAKINKILDEEEKYQFVLQMGRGMGKTSFTRYIASTGGNRIDTHFIPLHIGENDQYRTLDTFFWGITDKIRKNEKGELVTVGVVPFEFSAQNLGVAFATYINNFKEKLFPDKKLMIIIDGLEELTLAGAKTVLDLFKERDAFNKNIYIMFTSSLNATNESLIVSEKTGNFLEKHMDEVIRFNNKDAAYLQFLFNFFNDKIISKFPAKKEPDEILKTFENIEPKNILALSIIFKIVRVYLDEMMQTDMKEKLKMSVISSFENALKFYYEYVNERFAGDNLNIFKNLLSIISLADESITKTDIINVFGENAFNKSVIDNELSSVFITVKWSGADDYYSVIHDRIKEVIIKDNVDQINTLVSSILFNFKTLITKENLKVENLLAEGKSIIKFVDSVLNTDRISKTQLQEIFGELFKIDFSTTWSSTTDHVIKITNFLEKLIKIFEQNEDILVVDPLILARKYTILGINNVRTTQYFAARDYFMKAQKIYEGFDISKFDNAEKKEYVHFLSYFSTLDFEEKSGAAALEKYAKAIKLYEELWKDNYVGDISYLKNVLSLANVYETNALYKEQKKALDYSIKLVTKTKDTPKENIFGFAYLGYTTMYTELNRPSKALKAADLSCKYYEICVRDNVDGFYFGDYLKVMTFKIMALVNFKKSKNIVIEEIEKSIEVIESYKANHKFSNLNKELSHFIEVGFAYYAYKEYEKALEYAKKTESIINAEVLQNYRSHSIFHSHTEKNKKLLELLKTQK